MATAVHTTAEAARESVTTLAPHIYLVAAAAFRQMLRNKCSQSLVVSGESGAGARAECMKSDRLAGFLGCACLWCWWAAACQRAGDVRACKRWRSHGCWTAHWVQVCGREGTGTLCSVQARRRPPRRRCSILPRWRVARAWRTRCWR